MANEVRIEARTGVTCYFQVLNETNQVWNGTTFVSLGSATWTATAMTLTETPSGSGIYIGNFPTGITAAGEYGIRGCERLGGSAAAGDPVVGTGAIVWSGSAILDLSDAGAIVLDHTSGVETSVTLKQAMRLILAAASGKSTGAGTTTITFLAPDAATTRVTATVDGTGNRTSVTLSP